MKNTLNAVNVLVMKAGVPYSITSFKDNKKGNALAEELFKKEFFTIKGTEDELEEALENGFFENENHSYDSVSLIHSS